MTPPQVVDESWCRTPVDRFILARLERAGLAPNPAIDKRRLMRRLYFDLIGLPPAPREAESFLADDGPDVQGRLVDRLLADPHYGERWGRHWLDLARFAESHGFEHDYDRPTAYHYRDFAIEALNRDMPYDRFVSWQLAGDELAPDDNLALKATGFLAAGVHSTQITKNEVELHRYNEMDDMLATLGTSMLGISIGCARCHDHKYDPIPQGDYYRMLASFTTTVRSEVDLDVDPEGYRKAKEAFDHEHVPLVAALERFDEEELPSRLAGWESSTAEGARSSRWTILDPASTQSAGGATLQRLDDFSILASGKNPKHDTYKVSFATLLSNITAIRLEALEHRSLAAGGPGRAEKGQFALSDVKVAAAPLDEEQATPKPIVLSLVRAAQDAGDASVAAAIDDDEGSAWSRDAASATPLIVVFDMSAPIGDERGTKLTITLRFKSADGASLGRFRLAVASSTPTPPPEAGGLPEPILSILNETPNRRSESQQRALLKWFAAIDPRRGELVNRVEEHAAAAPKPTLVKALIASEGLPPIKLHSQGDEFFDVTHYLRRGDPGQKAGPATQGFLQVLTASAAGILSAERWQESPPDEWRTSYRRRALAAWMTDVEGGAGNLLARVIVNRLWQHHLGRGLVATPSDFGVRGERPTHPKLLDWLAGELIRGGWRLKPIHRLIVTSAVFMQSTGADDDRLRVDPENALFGRMPRRRLEAEVIRDAMLAAGGSLDCTMYGPGTLDDSHLRRGIYFTIKRSKLAPMMQVFDCPDALGGMSRRPTTTIAPQALLLMNNPEVRRWAESLAGQILPTAETSIETAIRDGFRYALSREPEAPELSDALAFVSEQAEGYATAGHTAAKHLALADFCQALFCLNEFVYVD